jgi:hypothetical protein
MLSMHDEQPPPRERRFWIGSMMAFAAFGVYTHEPIALLGAAIGLFLWLASIPQQKGSPS